MAKTKKTTKTAGKKAAAVKSKPPLKFKKPLPVPVIASPKKIKEDVKPTNNKVNYSKEELEHFKTIIMAKKKEILEELETMRDTMMDSQTGEYVSENSTYSTHMEQGTDAMEREKMFLFASREGKFLNHLEDALKRIEKGDYGHCSECGKIIEKERLEAVPHAQQCLQCKLRKGR
ncbi:MAG: TraR/DksA family transcriptional regulator [Bacteroidota bacterium]